MAEWKEVTGSVYDMDFRANLGPVVLRLRWIDLANEWVVDFAGTVFYKTFGVMEKEQAQAAALSWARGVLGAALVEAGAVVIEENCCELCDAIGPGSHCMFCSDEPRRKFFTMKPAKFARIDND